MDSDRELLEWAAKAAGYTTNHPWNAERLTFNPPVAYQIEDANGEFMCLSRTKSTVRGVTSKPLYDESALAAERAARIEAQQRLAEMQELAAKAGLAHMKAVADAVAEEVAAELEACEERVEDLYEKFETVYLVDITRAIHARDKT